MQKTNDVIGLGNALVDFLVRVDDDKLLTFGLNKGQTVLVEEEKAKELLEQCKMMELETSPGGCAANTMRGISFLGGTSIFCATVGEDEHGEKYLKELQKDGVETRINKCQKTTGHALTFITPDSERTFSVHLGAANELNKNEINEEDIIRSKVLYLEGFQLEGPTKQAILDTIELAKKHNTLVAIDLNDSGLIRRNKEFFKDLVKNQVDIIFLNETEAKEFTGLDEKEALFEIGKIVKIAIVKLGERGSLIFSEGKVEQINSFPANVIDTTGAGDTFAAGFLYGYCNEWDIKKSGLFGSLFAAKIVEKTGVKFNKLNLEELKRNF